MNPQPAPTAALPFTGLVVVVPTRNRADLAASAVRSVLTPDAPPVEVVVSDNSTSQEECARLREFCERTASARLHYIAPPEPLAMTPHYDWAFTQAMERFPEASHFTLLTDRMVFRPGELANLLALVTAHPNRVITYNHDRVDDYTQPVRLERVPWGGDAWEIPSACLLELASHAVLPGCLPHLMNNVVPRGVFEAVRARYGHLFDSVAPDYHFGFRCLEMLDTILYYDRSPLVHYALQRSNGESQARGIASPDHLDFVAELKGKSYSHAAPLPEVQTVGNAIVHEYCVVRAQTGSPEMPPVEWADYLRMLGVEVASLENPKLRERMRAVLAAQGWREEAAPVRPGGLRGVLARLFPLLCRPATLGLWMWLARRFGVRPPVRFYGFRDAEQALAADRAHPLPRSAGMGYLRGCLVPAGVRPEDQFRRVPIPDAATMSHP